MSWDWDNHSIVSVAYGTCRCDLSQELCYNMQRLHMTLVQSYINLLFIVVWYEYSYGVVLHYVFYLCKPLCRLRSRVSGLSGITRFPRLRLRLIRLVLLTLWCLPWTLSAMSLSSTPGWPSTSQWSSVDHLDLERLWHSFPHLELCLTLRYGVYLAYIPV